MEEQRAQGKKAYCRPVSEQRRGSPELVPTMHVTASASAKELLQGKCIDT